MPDLLYRPDFTPVLRELNVLLYALRLTLFVAAGTMVLGLIVGLIVALARISKIRALSIAAGFYIDFFRGIPQMVYLVFIYFGIALATGIDFEPMAAAILCLSTQYGGYLAEIYRSGIEAVGRGQREAAVSMGLTTAQSYRHIILPQAVRVIIPPMGNMWVGALKDSALVSYIGVMELMRVTQYSANKYWRPFEFYTAAALIYVFLVWLSSRGVNRLERSLKYE